MTRNVIFLFFLFVHFEYTEGKCRLPSHKSIGDLCYILPDNSLNFQDARQLCHQMSAQLAVIHTTTQANLLAIDRRVQNDNDDPFFWIGLSRQSVNSTFQWDDGTDINYSHFDSNYAKDDLYVVASTSNGKWRTINKDEEAGLACSYDPLKTQEPSCSPMSRTTYLYAYSNDLDPQTVQNAFFANWDDENKIFVKYGRIRFDTKIPEQIEILDDNSQLYDSVTAHLPDPTLSIGDDEIGSDILDVLQKFLDNADGVPLCGSQILIMLKRHPLKKDTSKLLAQLQRNHIFLRTFMSNTPILGENYQIMYNLSGLTNGLATFENDGDLQGYMILGDQFQIYSANPIVRSGISRTDLPLLYVPLSMDEQLNIRLEITLQDHGPLGMFHSVNLTLTNTIDSKDQRQITWDSTKFTIQSTSLVLFSSISGNSNYSVIFTTSFVDSDSANLQIRMSADTTPINYWLPYTNWN